MRRCLVFMAVLTLSGATAALAEETKAKEGAKVRASVDKNEFGKDHGTTFPAFVGGELWF